eukprot:jgi/Tetstr1/441250/TSEL_029501.t1
MAPHAAGVSLAPAGGRSFFPVLPRRPAPLQRPQLLQRGKGVASGSSVAAPPLRRWRVVAGGVYRWSSPAAGSPMDSHDESEKEMSPSGLDAAKAANLQDTKRLVEVSMLASMTGLAYFMGSVVKLEGYLGYFLPLPIVVSALRWGPATGWRTVVATCCLIAVLLGPVRMLTYFLMHGLLAATLGTLWVKRTPFLVNVFTGAVVRTAGLLGNFCISSWMINENLFTLILNNIYSFLDQIIAQAGSNITPSFAVVVTMLGSLMALNGIVYVFLMNVLYSILLRNLGYDTVQLPAKVQNMLYRPSTQPAP